MANKFKLNILELSGVPITISPNDYSTFLRHDGSFAYPSSGLANSGDLTTFNTNLASTGHQNYLTAIGGDTNLSGNLALTGSNLQSQINAIHPSSSITGINITGGNNLTGLFGFSQGSNITLTQIGNTGIQISSAGGGGGITNPSWGTLTWGIATIWNATSNVCEDKQRIILTGDSNLNISGLYDGWAGLLEVKQSGISSSGYALTVSGYALNSNIPLTPKVINSGLGILPIVRVSGNIDMVGLVYNGNNLYANIGNTFN